MNNKMNDVYSVRLMELLKTPFCDWAACKLGVINENGDLVKLPETLQEKSKYTGFHASVRVLKKALGVHGDGLAASIAASNLAESHGEFKYSMKTMLEAVVAGDSGGDPVDISSGVTSGNVVNVGPTELGKKKKKKELA